MNQTVSSWEQIHPGDLYRSTFNKVSLLTGSNWDQVCTNSSSNHHSKGTVGASLYNGIVLTTSTHHSKGTVRGKTSILWHSTSSHHSKGTVGFKTSILWHSTSSHHSKGTVGGKGPNYSITLAFTIPRVL